MCITSAVGDYYGKRFPEMYPWIAPHTGGGTISIPSPIVQVVPAEVSRAEFDALKRDVEEMKRILTVAKKYDEDTGQPDCEMADKVKLLRDIARLVGVDVYDVLATP